jgi:hypothetical protein
VLKSMAHARAGEGGGGGQGGGWDGSKWSEGGGRRRNKRTRWAASQIRGDERESMRSSAEARRGGKMGDGGIQFVRLSEFIRIVASACAACAWR